MLTELKRLHQDILMHLDALEALTGQPLAPMDRLPAVRLALTRASRARTMLLERIYDQLMSRAPAEQQAALQTLRAEGKDNLVISVGHIGTWAPQEIAARWSDYCAASNKVRSAMRQRIKQESALIYPLLSDAGRLPPQAHGTLGASNNGLGQR